MFDSSLSSGYFVRSATEQDVSFLVRMRLMLQQHMESANPDILRHNVAWRNRLPNMYREQIGDFDTLVLMTIDEDSGQAVGMAVSQLIQDPYMEVGRFVKINDVWVDEAYRRKGICSAMLNVIMEHYKDRGISTFTLNYVINNLEAESAWHAVGFKPIIRNCLLTRE